MGGRTPKWGTRTTYEGTTMRSRLEAGFAAHLDQENDRRQTAGAPLLTWQYEPHAFANRHGQYTPDFRIELQGRHAYVEVKPTHAQALGAHGRMHTITSSDPDAELWTANPVGLTRDDYRPERATWCLDRVRRPLAPDLASSLARGPERFRLEADGWHVSGSKLNHVLDATDHGGPWRYELGQRLDTDWAYASVEYHCIFPDEWFAIAAHGADGPYVPLIEVDLNRVITALHPSGHRFTHSPLDLLRLELGRTR